MSLLQQKIVQRLKFKHSWIFATINNVNNYRKGHALKFTLVVTHAGVFMVNLHVYLVCTSLVVKITLN